jgi:hypothetical protein
MRVDDEHWPLAATAQESSSSSAIDALLGGLFSAPSPSKDEEKPESASSSSFIPHPSSLSDTPEPVASAKAETPPPLDDELEQLLAATSSRAKTVDRASAPEKKPDAAPPSSSPAIDALLGGLFHSNTPVPPVEAVPSSSDPDRFDLSVNALEDMLGGGKTGR